MIKTQLDRVQNLQDVQMYGALCTVRLTQIGALGKFTYREPLERYLDGLFDESRRSPDARTLLFRAEECFPSFDPEEVKHYQSMAIESALIVGGDLERPGLTALDMHYGLNNGWRSIDSLCKQFRPGDFEEHFFTNQEAQLQGADIEEILCTRDRVTGWEMLRDRARSAGERMAAVLTELARELRWDTERPMPGRRDRQAEEEARIASLEEPEEDGF
jgi:hypothetical protein